MAYIGRSVDIGMFEKQVLTPNSSTTTFNLNFAVGAANSLLVVYGGVIQEPNVAYSVSGGGQQIVFSEAPVTGTTLYIIYLGKQLSTPRTAGQETTKQTFTGDGTTTLFTLTDAPVVPAGIMVFVDGILQREGSGNNYVSSGSTINFNGAPDNGAEIDVYTLVKEKVSIDTVADGSITRAKLAANHPDWNAAGDFTFITSAKIKGDFSNSTVANRTAFQSSTANSPTRLTVVPSGTGTISALNLHGASDPTNASVAQFNMVDGTSAQVQSNRFGSGTYYPLTFHTSNLEQIRLNTDGAVEFKLNGANKMVIGGTGTVNGIAEMPTSVGTPLLVARDSGSLRSAHFAGNLKFSSGFGIDFSDSPNASGATSEILNDYEEGTWTPSYSCSGTNPSGIVYGSRFGNYVKVGNIVTITCNIHTTAMTSGGSGYIWITGLPFSAGGTYYIADSGISIGLTAYWTVAPVAGGITAGNTYIALYKGMNNNSAATDFAPGSSSQNYIRFQATYIAA